MSALPALSLAAVPGRRSRTLELAREIEKRGFAGIYCPSIGDGLALCEALAFVTSEIRFGTSITPIYTRHPWDVANAASFIHEVSNGRFILGAGVSHAPTMERFGLTTGKPLSDMREFVEALRSAPRAGELPPIMLATLQRRMIRLAEEIADGIVFANAPLSHMGASLSALSSSARDGGFFIGNMIPTCVNEDRATAAAVNRRTLTSYAMLPNYRNYWREAGYEEEMAGVEAAMRANDMDGVSKALSDRWLADTTLFGSPAEVREGIEAHFDAGVRTPIIVPSSANGGQFVAFEEFFSIWD